MAHTKISTKNADYVIDFRLHGQVPIDESPLKDADAYIILANRYQSLRPHMNAKAL